MKKIRVIPHTNWAATSLWSFNLKTLLVLIFSLSILGIGDGLIVLSQLGSTPWTVFSQGIALKTNMSIGWSSFLISCIVMLIWIPLKLRLGLGTLLNIIIIAFFLGITVEQLPSPSTFLMKTLFITLGLLLYALGTALYLTCHLGAGPRDGLMVGFCQRFQLKVGIVRSTIEITVCIVGFLLGGTIGIGTLFFALLIGWLVQICLTFLGKFTSKEA